MINWTWVIQVLVPYLALMSLFILIKGRTSSLDFYSKIAELSVETGILGIGVSAAVLGAAEAQKKMGAQYNGCNFIGSVP